MLICLHIVNDSKLLLHCVAINDRVCFESEQT